MHLKLLLSFGAVVVVAASAVAVKPEIFVISWEILFSLRFIFGHFFPIRFSESLSRICEAFS